MISRGLVSSIFLILLMKFVDHSFSMGIGVHSKGVRVEELELATKLVQDLITKDDIVIFSKTYCPYCKIAKDVFDALNCKYTVVELDQREDGGAIQAVLGQMTGVKTVPRVFLNGHCIGGGNEDDDEQKLQIMRKAFQMFDTTKSGFIDTIKISTILNTMGQIFDDGELNALIEESDPDGSGKVNFDGFCRIAAHFLEEDDAEAMQEELKEAFRLYDREGNGYITTATLREILAALDDKLTSEDLDGIIAEIDTDGSGTVDFDEFMEMMTGE